MASDPELDQPVKVTLYLPRRTILHGKLYAKNTHGTSLSKLTNQLLVQEMEGTFPQSFDCTREMLERLNKKAKKTKKSLGELIHDILDEGLRD